MPAPPFLLTVAPHWREAVDDVVGTVVDPTVSGDDAPQLVSARQARRAPSGSIAVLASDPAEPRPLQRLRRARPDIGVFRLWWNGADEVRGWAASPSRPGPETAVCFFPEAAAELADLELGVRIVPFAFSPPAWRDGGGQRAVVTYTSEVDVSDRCFASYPDREHLSERAWALAHDVCEGTTTMVEADQAIRRDVARHDAAATTLWALRNRVRRLLVQAVDEAFPGRLQLRGSDWRALGYEAASTRFNRKALLRDYRQSRVALDLGSKSTHAMLYPRSADVLAVGAGLAQLDTGAPRDGAAPLLKARRARGATEVVALVDRLLTAPLAAVQEENRALHEEYVRTRAEAGRALLRLLRGGPEGPRGGPVSRHGGAG